MQQAERANRIISLASPFAVAVAASVLLVIAAFVTHGRSATLADTSPTTIDSLAFNSVVEGTVLDGPNESRFIGYSNWSVSVDEVLFDRGSYYSLAYGEMVEQKPPEIGEVIVIAVLEAIEIRPGTSYAFYAARSFRPDPAQQSEFPWQSELVFARDEGYLPTAGVENSVLASLDLVSVGDESLVDSAIAFAREYAGYLNQRNSGHEPTYGPRMAALVEASTPATGVDSWLEILAQRPENERQLPSDLDDLSALQNAQVQGVFNVETWTPWTVILLLDPGAVGTTEWFGAYIEGAGFLGPVGGSPGDQVVELIGYGPSTSNRVELLRWAKGMPAEVLADASDVAESVRATRAEDLGPVDADLGSDNRGTSDVILLVDLRGGHVSSKLVSLTEANQTLIGLLGESEPRSEPSPSSPPP